MIPILSKQNNPMSNSSSYPGRNRSLNYTKLSFKMYIHKLKIYGLYRGTNANYFSGLYSVSFLVLISVLGNYRVNKIAADLVPCSSLLAMKDVLWREVWINGKYNLSFVNFSVWCIFIAARAGSFVNRVWFCVLTRSILSSHAACDHLVCVGL